MEDLNAWWDKVKVGGLVTGDDYLWRPEDDYPVKRAVDQFVKERGLEVWLVQPTQFAIY